LSKKVCERCIRLGALWHERAGRFLCVPCIERFEDDNPDELTNQ